MEKNTKPQIEMFLRVLRFGTANSSDFPADAFAGRLFRQMSTVYFESLLAAGGQVGRNPRATTARKEKARITLRKNLMAISRTAQSVDFRKPEMSVTFSPPKKETDQDLLAAARAFAQNAEPFQEEFVHQGLPPNFIDDLETNIAAFEQSISERVSASRSSATAARVLKNSTARGHEIVARLDRVIRRVYREQEDKLDLWKRARTMTSVDSFTDQTPTADAETMATAA